MSAFQFTIPFVLDCETGEEIEADSFFAQEEAIIFPIRRQLEEAIQDRQTPKFKCYHCGQLIKIKGKTDNETKHKRMHFAHQWDSDDCPLKTNQVYSKRQLQAIKYNGQKESEIHRRTKELVASSLERNKLTGKGVTAVVTETIQRDKSGLLNWRKPDVKADYKQYKVVFEIQLSTTFLSVIADREHFYQQNQTFIIWIFKQFPQEADRQRFTEKDVFYANNQNAFVFDEEAIEESIQQQDLVLKCLYLEPYQFGQTVLHRWSEQLITLNDLTFELDSYKAYFYDVAGKTELLTKQIDEKQRKHRQRLIDADKRFEVATAKTASDFTLTCLKLRDRIAEQFPAVEERSPLVLAFTTFSKATLNTLFDLFGEGYQATPSDKAFINREFQREKANRTMLERDDLLTCLCLATCLIKLDKSNKAHRLKKVSGIVFAILSVKLDCVVGQKFTQLIQVAHSLIPGKWEYGDLFLKAITHYPHKTIEQQDAKVQGKFARKVDAFQKQQSVPNHGYDDVFRVLFPELF